MSRSLYLILLVGIAFFVYKQIYPDFQRYMRIRAM